MFPPATRYYLRFGFSKQIKPEDNQYNLPSKEEELLAKKKELLDKV